MRKIVAVIFLLLIISQSALAFSVINDDKSYSSSNSYSYKHHSSGSNSGGYQNAKQFARDNGGFKDYSKSANFQRNRAYGDFRKRNY